MNGAAEKLPGMVIDFPPRPSAGESTEGITGVTIVAQWESIRSLVEGTPAPKRPNRSAPLSDDSLHAELEAWDAASDEALDAIERETPES